MCFNILARTELDFPDDDNSNQDLPSYPGDGTTTSDCQELRDALDRQESNWEYKHKGDLKKLEETTPPSLGCKGCAWSFLIPAWLFYTELSLGTLYALYYCLAKFGLFAALRGLCKCC